MVDTLHGPVALLDEQQGQLRSSSRRLEPPSSSSSSSAAAIKQARRQSMRPQAQLRPPPMVRSLSDDQQRGQRTSSLAPSSPPPSINAPAPSLSRPAGVAAASPVHERVHEEPIEEDSALQWPQQQQQQRGREPPPALPTRTVGRGGLTSAPTLPPRPVAPSSAIYPSAEPVSPSSCPPVLSPFATAFDNENDPVAPLMRPSASRSPERPRFRAFGGTGGQAPAGNSSGGGLSSSASYSSLNPSSALSALGRGWQQAKLKDRLGAGVGYAKEWGGKGKGKLQDQWRGLGSGSAGGGTAGRDTHRPTASISTHGDSSASVFSSSNSTNSFAFSNSSGTLSSFLSPSTTMPDLASSASIPSGSRASALSPARGTVRLPAVLYSVPVPDRHGVVFGRPLVAVVELTRAPSLPRPSSKDEVTGDDARYWLPGIAFRCLEYLEEWGMREEGVFRVPGRSSHTADLKTMFDAGVGQDRDLREIHPSELDPHAVASVFKSWLRDLPDPLLSHEMEPTVDEMTIHALGYGASSNNFLASKSAAAAAGTPTSSAGGTPASSAPASPNISQGYVEQLRDLMATRMPAEHWHLLRAVIFHLARLADHARPNEAAMRHFGHADPSEALPPLPARRPIEAPNAAVRQLEAPRIDADLANETARSRSPALMPDLAPPSPSAIPSSSPAATPRTHRFVSQVQEASPVTPRSNDSRSGRGDSEEVELRISPEPPQLERLSLGEEFRDAIEQFDRSVGGKVPTAEFDFEADLEQEQEQERLADRTPSRPKTHRKGHSNLSISSMRSFMSSTSLSSTASSTNGTSSESDLRSARVRHAHTASSSSSFWRRKPPASSSVSAAEKALRRQSVAITLPIGLGVDVPGDNKLSTGAFNGGAHRNESIAQSGLLSVEERRRLFGG
ncbi:hypothetical protein B0A53_04579 [Rhodotorula sp. CCFEE 5036]|nr:hypothetical protein B0A53_04579 [Rhodotorula sp. CCFEE 5036]